MIDFNTAIELIRRNGGFKPNRRDTSYYRTNTMEDSRPMQARVSNHGTWLWTWYDKDYDPSYAINTCVVYSENGEDKSDVSVDMEIKDEEGNVVGERKSFEVTQYVYNCQILDDNDAALINQAVQNIWQNKGFKDPLVNTHKHAKVMILRPNETPEIITETKYTNMNKKQIRLTESDLKQIVKESVNKILNEAYGTPNKWTTSATYNINQARNDDRNYIKNADNEPVNASLADFLNDMLHVSDKLSDQNDVLRRLDGKYNPYASPSYKPCVQALYKIGDKLTFIVNRMISIANMEEGEQPDEYYDINHESYKQKQKRRKKEAYHGG